MKINACLYFALLAFLFTDSEVMAQTASDAVSAIDSVSTVVSASEPKSKGKGSNFFGGFTSGYAGTAPKISTETYHLGFSLGKGGSNYWDLYVFNTVPTVSPVDTVQYVGNDLRRQFAGILNFSVSKTAYFAYGKDPSVRDVKGLQTDLRFGMKLVNTPIRRADQEFLIPVFQSTFDVRYLIPLLEAREATATKSEVDIKKDMVGNLAFRISGSYLSVINTSSYDLYFTTKKGILPNPNIIIITPELRFYVTNQVDFGIGYAYNNDDVIGDNLFFSISYGAK